MAARGLTPSAGGLLGFLHGVNLVFHEAGHVIFGLFGEFLGILGGSALQVLMPAACAASFLLRHQPASASMALGWTGESLTNVAIYVADGKRMALPLLAEGLIHDWNWILGRLGWLERADGLGRLTFALGFLVILGALGLLALDLLRVWTAPAPIGDGAEGS